MKRWAGIARLGGVGDNLMAASVLAPLKRMGYMTEVISSEPNHVVYLNNPHIDKLSIKNVERDMPQNDMMGWQKWFDSRAHEFDIFLHASHTCEGRHALFPTMTSFWWPPDYRRNLCGGSYLETVHDVIGVPHEFGPLFYSSDEEKERAAKTKEEVGGKCISWVLSGTRIDKVYPPSGVVVARIIKELGIPVVVQGGPSEKEIAMAKAMEEYVAMANGSLDGFHQAITQGEKSWPLRRSLAFAQAADLVVTPDTGTAWAVAFEPMPKVLLASHASEENITKHWLNTINLHADTNRVPCWPCHRLHNDPSTCVENKDKNGAACISDISVELIMNAVKAALKGEGVEDLRDRHPSQVGINWSNTHDNVVHAAFPLARGGGR